MIFQGGGAGPPTPHVLEFCAGVLVFVLVFLPRGAVNRSVISDCGISWSFTLDFFAISECTFPGRM